MLHVRLSDRIRNTELRKRSGVTDVVERVAKLKWSFAGHVARTTDQRWTKRLVEWRPREDRRSRGRPPTRWSDDIRRLAGDWLRKAQDRDGWRNMGEAYVQQWTEMAV